MVMIRAAGLEGCGAVAALVAALTDERGDRGDCERAEAVAQALVASPDRDLVLADVDGEVVGYLAVHWIPFPLLQGWEGYISDLVVRQDRRGSGVGSRLVAEAESQALARGCVRLMLNNSVMAESFKRDFFNMRGYRRRGEFANFVKNLRPSGGP